MREEVTATGPGTSQEREQQVQRALRQGCDHELEKQGGQHVQDGRSQGQLHVLDSLFLHPTSPVPLGKSLPCPEIQGLHQVQRGESSLATAG